MSTTPTPQENNIMHELNARAIEVLERLNDEGLFFIDDIKPAFAHDAEMGKMYREVLHRIGVLYINIGGYRVRYMRKNSAAGRVFASFFDASDEGALTLGRLSVGLSRLQKKLGYSVVKFPQPKETK